MKRGDKIYYRFPNDDHLYVAEVRMVLVGRLVLLLMHPLKNGEAIKIQEEPNGEFKFVEVIKQEGKETTVWKR